MNLKLKKGVSLNIAGAVPQGKTTPMVVKATECAIVPDDFEGFVPKLAVKEGDAVAVGTPLLYEKNHPEMKLVSPLAGRVSAVVRGERRKIMRVVVEADKSAGAASPVWSKATDEASARALLAQSGLMAMMRRRPYAIVPEPDDVVRDIFVTAMDLAPLAVSPAVFSTIFSKEDYEAGVKLLSLITKGKIYLSHGSEWNMGDIRGAEMVAVEGPYPASNAGVQAANISPVNKGEVIWTLDLPTLGRIGRLASKGELETRTLAAITGPEVAAPAIVETTIGAPVAPLLAGRTAEASHHHRVISGNVLVGTAVDADGYLEYPYRQITVIAEGDDTTEFMGWASFSPSKMSESNSFPGHFLKRIFRPDARLNGGRRAMIMSGQYDKAVPMDILTEYLVKAILAGNIEDMEKLGIYEVAPEDFAAAEYADTSKLPLQKIIRDGLDYVRKELE